MKNKSMLFAIILIVIVILIIIFTIGNKPQEDTIKIGVILHLSNNDYSDVGVAMKQGIDLYVDNLNKKGGINGKKIKLIYVDSQNNLTIATNAARKLINIDKVSAVLVSTYGEAMAIGPIFESAHIPLIVLWDSNKDLDALGKYIFSIGVWTESSGTRIADFAINDLSIKKIAIISHNTEWSSSVTDFFKKRFTSLGGKIVFEESVNPDTTDFKTVLLKANSSNADALFAPIDRKLDVFFKQSKEIDFNKQILGLESITQQVIDTSRGAADGVYFTTFAIPDNYPLTNIIKDEYITKYGNEPKLFVYVGFGYDGILTVAEAIRLSHSSNPENIMKSIYTIHNLKGSFGIINFNKDGSSPRYESVFHIENGKKAFVKN